MGFSQYGGQWPHLRDVTRVPLLLMTMRDSFHSRLGDGPLYTNACCYRRVKSIADTVCLKFPYLDNDTFLFIFLLNFRQTASLWTSLCEIKFIVLRNDTCTGTLRSTETNAANRLST